VNWAHIHIMINHTPIIGAVFGFAFLAYAVWRKSAELEKVGLGILVIVAVTAIATFLTGDPAEQFLVSVVPGIPESVRDRHCTLAAVAMGASIAAGVCALVGLAVSWRAKAPHRGLLWACLPLAGVALVLMAWTGHRGAQIRHTEIRPGGQVVSPSISGGE
jgi:uncharacterized membrane protein